MKNAKWQFFIIGTLWLASCSSNLTVEEVNSHIDNTTDLVRDGKLEELSLPNRSKCGGAVNGYFHGNKLLYIDSELNVSNYTNHSSVVFYDDEIIEIKSREFFPITDSTRTDTTYIVKFSKPIHSFKVIPKGLRIDTNVSSERITRLMNCANVMREELIDLKRSQN